MAIWQLDFHIIPSDWLYSDITNGDECLWINKKISKSDIVAPEFLKMFKSNDDEIQYGDYDKTCIMM